MPLFPCGDGLERGHLHLHPHPRGGLHYGVGAVAADELHVDAAGGHQLVAGLQAVAVGGLLLGPVVLRLDEEKVEHGYHSHNHYGGLPAIGDVE